MTHLKSSYRPEIDGLRAVAVISVIFYHAQIVLLGKDWFVGGFIGVDVFFVISGYLITRIILSELYETGSFNFLSFYERRARRILPVLFLVIFVSTPYAWQKLLPSDFVEYAESVIASLFFGSNFFFYYSTTEYGADSSLLKPFLHTWSLGVEEQFYLVFPILAIITFKFFNKHFLTILVALSVLSLLFADFMEVRNPELNFYLPFSRFWELAAGAILSYRELNHRHIRHNSLIRSLPMIGLLLITYSIFVFNENTPHPSFHTIIPILGVTLVIAYSSKKELVGKVLGSRPFVWMGLISYSAYLWHFPIFALSRYSSTESTNYDKLEWIFLTILLSIISFFAVEKPFRRSGLISQNTFLKATTWSMVLISLGGGFFIWSNSYKDPIKYTIADHMDQVEFLKLRTPIIRPNNPIGSNRDEEKSASSCYKRTPSEGCIFGSVEIITLGDSFVGSLEPTLLSVLHEKNIGLQTLQYPQCAYLSDKYSIPIRVDDPCATINRERENYFNGLTESKTFIVFHAKSSFYQLTRKNALNNTTDAILKDHFSQLQKLLNAGHKIILLYGVPNPKINSRLLLPLLTEFKYSGENIFGHNTYFDILNRERSFEASFSVLNANQNFSSINLADVLCEREGSRRCYDMKESVGPIYNNGAHLSYLGAKEVVSRIVKELRL